MNNRLAVVTLAVTVIGAVCAFFSVPFIDRTLVAPNRAEHPPAQPLDWWRARVGRGDEASTGSTVADTREIRAPDRAVPTASQTGLDPAVDQAVREAQAAAADGRAAWSLASRIEAPALAARSRAEAAEGLARSPSPPPDHGQLTLSYPDGAPLLYSGQIAGGFANGDGVAVLRDGGRLAGGPWRNGRPNGYFVAINPDHQQARQWKDGARGELVVAWMPASGDTFYGEGGDADAQGRVAGVWLDAAGGRLEGRFIVRQLSEGDIVSTTGVGVLTRKDGTVVQGGFQSGRPMGPGRIRYPDGRIKQGNLTPDDLPG